MFDIIEEQSGKVVRKAHGIAQAGAMVDTMNESASWARTGKTYDFQVAKVAA